MEDYKKMTFSLGSEIIEMINEMAKYEKESKSSFLRRLVLNEYRKFRKENKNMEN